jgi:hypothetical protein
MRLTRIVLALVLVGGLAGLAYVSQRQETPGSKMVNAAKAFLNTLTPQQRDKTVFAFDSKERMNFWFVPRQDKDRNSIRKGLPLKDMTAEQKKAALALVAAGTSARGNEQAVTIMSLEAILREQEKMGANVRDPEWYFFTVFGDPAQAGKWGWRVEGHHLSLNFTMDGATVVSATPAFFGSNPAMIKDGARKGQRILPEVEDLARELFKSLNDDQRKTAHRAKPFDEPKQATADAAVGPPQGLPASKMDKKQRDVLVSLVRAYSHRMPTDVAEQQLKEVMAAGVDNIHFAFSGSAEPGQGYTYRVQGPTFVIEFLNMQKDSAGNPANHIHSIWRNLSGDFGVKLK